MENIEPLINEINSLTNNEFNFNLKSATLFEDADFCVIEIFYRDGIMLNASVKRSVEKRILELVPQKFKYQIKFIKKFISDEQVTIDVNDFMKKNHSSISYLIESVKNSGGVFNINIQIDTLSFNHANQKSLSRKITKYLKKLYEDYDFCCEISETVIKNETESNVTAKIAVEEENQFEKRVINYTDITQIVGEEFDLPAKYIMDIDKPQKDVIVCGKIKNIKSVVLKKKSIENENQDSSENEVESIEEDDENSKSDLEATESKTSRTIFKWNLEGFTGSINCSFLSNKANISKLSLLKDNDEVAVKGNVVKDKFLNKLIINVKSIEYCKLPGNFEEYIAYKEEKPFYEFVKPEPIVIYRQDDLMSFAKEDIVPKYLQNKTFVCYDFETTGLHYDNGDRIVEIGAVKIVNGKITEKFVSFVNPDGKHIDEGASLTTGIYDEDVADAPKDYEVLQDFYKFTRGAIIIGYNNINFDNVFLLGQGKKCRYNFDNPMEDVFKFAQKYVTGVKNYKLGTVAYKLGVVLDNAHSAVFDALATAEVFIKIAEKM